MAGSLRYPQERRVWTRRFQSHNFNPTASMADVCGQPPSSGRPHRAVSVPSWCAGGGMQQLVSLVSTKRTRTVVATLASTVLMLAANASAQSDIVLKAGSPSARAGKWAVTTDSGAYGGAKIRHPDGDAAKVTT